MNVSATNTSIAEVRRKCTSPNVSVSSSSSSYPAAGHAHTPHGYFSARPSSPFPLRPPPPPPPDTHTHRHCYVYMCITRITRISQTHTHFTHNSVLDPLLGRFIFTRTNKNTNATHKTKMRGTHARAGRWNLDRCNNSPESVNPWVHANASAGRTLPLRFWFCCYIPSASSISRMTPLQSSMYPQTSTSASTAISRDAASRTVFISSTACAMIGPRKA